MKIKLYSRISCAPCQTIKYWFQRKGIQYEELDADEHGVATTPTIEINGQKTPIQSITQLIRLLV